jgi:hypothetical protein
MGYTLKDIRDYVYLHLDLDSTELPESLLNVWCREATSRIVNAKPIWPFFEADWELVTVADVSDYPFSGFSPEVDEITSVLADQRRLTWIGRDEAERRYLPYQASTGLPDFFSTWKSALRLYPSPSGAETFQLRGYRKPVDWVALGDAQQPDLPDDFHDLIRIYVLSNAYAQQEDTQMAQMYRSNFQEELMRLVKTYGDSPRAFPLILGAGPRLSERNRLLYPFEY